VIGFSQTNQWFTAGFENFVENNRWQLVWRSVVSAARGCAERSGEQTVCWF